MGQLVGSLTPLLKQTWVVSGVLFTTLSLGIVQGYMSVLLTALKEPDSPIKVDVHLASWLASGVGMSVFVGIITATASMEFFGRKIAFVLQLLPGVIASILMYSAKDFTTLMIARLLDGIAGTGAVIVGSVIIGEYTSPAYRGMFLNLKTSGTCLGSTIVHGLGHFLHWKTIALITLVPYAVALVTMTTSPESPAWLARRKKFAESEKSFIWLRGDSRQIRKELNDLIKIQGELALTLGSNSLSIMKFFKKFSKRNFLKPVSILITTITLLELCGRHIIPAYAADIISGIVGNKSHSFYYTLAIDMIVTISATCSSILIRIMKSRTLLFSSGIASLFALSNACLYLFLVSRDVISNDKPWIPISMFIVFFIAVNLGCTPISLALIGEIFPLEHKSCGLFVSISIASVVIVITLKIFPYLLLHLHIYGTFAIFGLFMAGVLVVLYFILPETKDKTLQEIEDNFGRVRRHDQSSEKMLD